MIKRQLFSADLTVAEVLEQCPSTAAVFLKHRMACVGCPMASFETLGASSRVYRVPLDAFLKELELAVANSN